MIFSFLRWTIVPTARLTPTLVAQSGCLHSANYQHLPLKFNCHILLFPTSSFPQETRLSYLHILRNCCRLALFANPPWNSWPCVQGGREWNSSLEAVGRTEIKCCVCS